MLQLECQGKPYSIGHRHGDGAKTEIARSISFYANLFEASVGLHWTKVEEVAAQFADVIERKWPAYHEEMRGVAEGAGRSVNEIVALNVRTEINFGLITDGCTALAHCADGSSFLAQNWDWMPKQKENLIQLTILQAGKPTIKMITEAGIIGKIGLNSEGVGVCLNAIRAKGVDKNRLPCHLALRLVLECSSAAEAEKALKSVGVASACHMLIADEHGSVGVECSSIDLQFLRMNHSGQIFHTNHFLAEHKGVHDTVWLKDSPVRLARLEHLCGMLAGEVSLPQIASIFRDTEGLPVSICRDDESQTLFSIAMDLCRRTAYVVMGKPTEREEELVLSF